MFVIYKARRDNTTKIDKKFALIILLSWVMLFRTISSHFLFKKKIFVTPISIELIYRHDLLCHISAYGSRKNNAYDIMSYYMIAVAIVAYKRSRTK